jgi:vacuolar-type H+-ATPase subunit E/Vma4
VDREEENKILDAIEADVKSNASLVQDMLQKETDAFHEGQLTSFKEGLKKETETYLARELNEAKLYAAAKASKDQMETKKKLLRLREELAEELFDEVRQDLKQFVDSSAYEDYLLKNIQSLPVSPSGVFLCRKDDVSRLQKVLKAHGYANAVEERPMAIGCFLYRDEQAGKEYSCALEDKLEKEMEWFRANSGFKAPSREEKA